MRAPWLKCLFLALAGLPPAGAAPAGSNAAGRLELRLGDAVWLALTNNRSLAIERLEPDVRRTVADEERAAFDPVLKAEGVAEHDAVPGATNLETVATTRRTGGAVGLSEYLPTGTRIDLGLGGEREELESRDPRYASRAELAASQALLQGRPVAVNLVRLRQARLDTEISEYELRGYIETLVAVVESAYWECALAQRRVDIYERSLALAQRQLKEIEHRIRVGDLPETELAAARAESALREEELINARGALATAFLRLRRLIDPELLAEPRPELALSTEPAAPDIRLGPVSAHVALAFNMRAELNEARLRVQRNDLELVRTRNGLLPKLDFFIALGLTGYARSFGDSMTEMDGDHYAVSGGLRLEFPVGNRAAGARHQRAQLTREQSAEALRNLTDLVQVEVESAYIDVERTRAQITATATTRQFQEEKVYAETQKYEVGRSTSLLVTQAQRDLVQSQVAEATAVVRYLEALVALYRLEGTLLERRGLAAADRLPANEAFNPAPY